jgi:hypothetical protein
LRGPKGPAGRNVEYQLRYCNRYAFKLERAAWPTRKT